ncbi:MAG: trehalose-phosphatase [Pseudomonadota bacterium]
MTLPLPPILSDDHALFLDFDGTLAPLQAHADDVHLTDAQKTMLIKLADVRDGAMALLSGRDVRDLAKRTPEGLMRVGNHGLYRMAGGETEFPNVQDPPTDLVTLLEMAVAKHDGAFLEVKGPVATIHYRACPDAGPVLIDAVQSAAARQTGYISKVGNHVAEALPESANKGAALEALMQEQPYEGRVPVMVGDDTTDEDGFLAAQRLGGFGVKVGAGETVARKRLKDVSDVWTWLEKSL